MFGYVTEKSTGNVVSYFDLKSVPEETDEYSYTECLESEKPDLVFPVSYKADVLIAWALQQGFASDIMTHMAAFLDFANKANEVSKTNFLIYATAVDLVSTANTIIDKAIELGANITGGD